TTGGIMETIIGLTLSSLYFVGAIVTRSLENKRKTKTLVNR
ncbi:twin-arginine translocase subunit TatC, partial [Sulfolobus sp. E3]